MTGGVIEIRATKFKPVQGGVSHCFLIHYYTDDLALISLKAIYFDAGGARSTTTMTFEPSKGDWHSGWEFFTSPEDAVEVKVGIVTVGGTGYIDDVWFGESTGEVYTLVDRPVYPFTRISRKDEIQKRSITNRATIFRKGDAKREFPFEFYATPKEQMEKLREFFREYPYYYLEPGLSAEKKSYYTYWADTNFSFEELPGGAYFSGSMKLVEV
jgi:hypothetical protein